MKSKLRLTEAELEPFKPIILAAVSELRDRELEPSIWRIHWLTGLEPEEVHRAFDLFRSELSKRITVRQMDESDLWKPLKRLPRNVTKLRE
jgi:hypothetical protein